MTRPLLAAATALLVPVMCCAGTDAIQITDVATTSQTVSGQPITVPTNPKVHVSTYTFAPGAKLTIHKHPYPRYAYVMQGELDVTLVDHSKTLHFKKGDFFAEVIDGWHFGINTGTEPVILLVIDQTPQDAETNTVKQNSAK